MMQSALPANFPVLDAGDYVLRRIELSDEAHWHRYLSDPAVTELTSIDVELHPVREVIEHFLDGFARKRAMRWAIAPKATGAMIGDCGYNHFDFDNASAVIGYSLSREFWGRGVMTTCVNEMLRWGFEELDLNRIEATVNVENDRSARVLEKLGFRIEGRLREYRRRRGIFAADSHIFGLLRREWIDVATARRG
jgi:ribosomal-protein-alanine N-acetyltransferase